MQVKADSASDKALRGVLLAKFINNLNNHENKSNQSTVRKPDSYEQLDQQYFWNPKRFIG
jgi:hypothetical protein